MDSTFAYLLLEHADDGELLDRVISVKQLSEKLVAKLARQLLSAVEYASEHGVVHLDLKPENLMLDSRGTMRLKIIDFGLNAFIGPDNYFKIKKPSVRLSMCITHLTVLLLRP